MFLSRISRYVAMIEDIPTWFLGIVLALGRQKYKLMRDGMNLTMVKHCFAVAENEIDIAFNIAV